MRYFFFFIGLLCFLSWGAAFAQQPVTPNTKPKEQGSDLDSLRKREESSRDTIIYNSKFIRYTNRVIFHENTETRPIDTTLNRLQNYNVLNQPEYPTANLGNLGLAYRPLLFSPSKSIGFDRGFHAFDIYKLNQDSLRYYRARAPFTSLYYVNGSRTEQVFRVIHSQNITRHWNVGANYFRIGARGIYQNQNSDHMNASVFSWYESPNRRYNMFVNGVFNTVKVLENGGIVSDTLFTGSSSLGSQQESVKLGNTSDPTRQKYKENTFYLSQSYYIGRIDTVVRDSASRVLPTQRLSHAFTYTSDFANFYKNDADAYNVFPDISNDRIIVSDSTSLKHIRNEFNYSFYLRGGSVKFIRNEMKLDLGLQHDIYQYKQMGYNRNFSNTMLKGTIGYRFSDKVLITGNINQVAQGRNAGDFLYEAQARFKLSKSLGQLVLGAYTQNRSPEMVYEEMNYTYQNWSNNFDKTKVNNLSFAYQNPKYKFSAKAEYFLVNNYLYLSSTMFPNEVIPVQDGSNISMLKVTVGKKFTFGDFNLETYLAYQKSTAMNILRIPEFYTYNSFYWGRKAFKNALNFNFGVDARMNSAYTAASYAVNIAQFYNGPSVKFNSYPIIDVWARFGLKRANIFIRYDYANSGLFSKGYYTVNRYPMPGSLMKYGVIWNFYD